MMKRICAWLLGAFVFVACNKKNEERAGATEMAQAALKVSVPQCAKEIITEQPVKVGETGIVLPVRTKLCFSADNLEIRIELPAGYAFLAKGMETDKPLPIWATYTCSCSENGNCQVFYASGLGFGCLQSTCNGTCTGKFTYKGYAVERVVALTSKTDVLNLPEVQKEISAIRSAEPYSKHSLYGVSFYIVNDEARFMAAAKCDCEGTAACKLKVLNILVKKIYYCEGTCNGCELTV